MLTNSRNYNLVAYDEIDFIHNYYERLVLEEIFEQSVRAHDGDRDFLADVACVALNRMPPRYIRHDVDMTFFMSPQDMQEIHNKVVHAVTDAINYVESRERGEDPKLPTVDVSLSGTRASKSTKTAEKSTHEEKVPKKISKSKASKK
jgi:hypothetical protein